MTRQVFVSHSSDDHELARELVKVLEEFEINCWIAPRDVPSGDSWDVSIINAIERCSGVLFLVSENSNTSEQAKREVQIAVESDKWLLPICVDGTKPSKKFKYYLTSKQWFDLGVPPEPNELKELLNEISHKTGDDIQFDDNEISLKCKQIERSVTQQSSETNTLLKSDSENERTRLIPKFADSGTESMFQFFTGELDVAYMGITPFVLGVVYGLPIKIIGVAQELDRSHGIILQQNSILEKKEDLKIGTVFGSSGHYLAYEWMKREDLEVSFVNLSTSEQKEAFEYGFLDGVAVWEPHLSILKNRGGQCVFDTSELDKPIYNIIAASESAIKSKRIVLRQFLKTHFSAIDHIENDDSIEYEDYFQVIYGKEISAQKYGEIIINGYNWPQQSFLNHRKKQTPVEESLEESLENCLSFLNEFGLIGESDINAGNCFPAKDHTTNAGYPNSVSNDLKLGYSDSMLCATFHISQRLGLFEEFNTEIRSDERRLVEKVASFDKTYRDKISEIRELFKSNFEAAIVVLGKENNKLFDRIYHQVFDTDPPDEFQDLLDELDGAGVLPSHVLTSAHWIRQLQKIAANEESVTNSQANDALTRFVDILEWFHNERDSLSQINGACPDCGQEIENSDWKVCPQCGSQLSNVCDTCGEELKSGWDHCPQCGNKF